MLPRALGSARPCRHAPRRGSARALHRSVAARRGDEKADLRIGRQARVAEGGYSPTNVLHCYRKLRTILAYATKRGTDLEECRRALDVLAMLEVKGAHPVNPRQTTPAAFCMVHASATANGDRTFAAPMLTAPNACMYSGEVAAPDVGGGRP